MQRVELQHKPSNEACADAGTDLRLASDSEGLLVGNICSKGSDASCFLSASWFIVTYDGKQPSQPAEADSRSAGRIAASPRPFLSQLIRRLSSVLHSGISESERFLKGTSQIKTLSADDIEGMRVVCKVRTVVSARLSPT